MTFRRIIQLINLFLFLFLLSAAIRELSTDWPVDLYLRMDPALVILTIFSAGIFLLLFLPMLVLLAATLILGRFFCSHICPMGTTLELIGKLKWFPVRKNFPAARLSFIKYLVLGFLVGASLLGVSWIFLASPLSLITRIYGLLLYPIAAYGLEGGLNIFRPLAEGLNWNRLAFAQVFSPRFATQGFILVFFSSLVVLEFISPRFWCRTLCPSGAILSFFSFRPLLARRVSSACTDCGKCARVCPMKAIGSETLKSTRHGECIVCFSCKNICPEKAISFSKPVSTKKDRLPLFLPERRYFLLSGFAGILSAASSLTGLESPAGKPGPGRVLPATLLRPPASLPEKEFLSRCVRCGECMTACPTNTLQPLWLQAGFMGIFSPALTPRRGYCLPDCRQCSLVCPTGAITYLTRNERIWAKTGTAVIYKEKCLAWEHKKKCMVCDEVCPFKAVEFRFEPRNPVPVPEILEERCTGCGYCEHYCPVQNQAAIVVSPMGAIRLVGGSYLETAKRQGLNFTLRQTRSIEYPSGPSGSTSGRAPGFD